MFAGEGLPVRAVGCEVAQLLCAGGFVGAVVCAGAGDVCCVCELAAKCV